MVGWLVARSFVSGHLVARPRSSVVFGTRPGHSVLATVQLHAVRNSRRLAQRRPGCAATSLHPPGWRISTVCERHFFSPSFSSVQPRQARTGTCTVCRASTAGPWLPQACAVKYPDVESARRCQKRGQAAGPAGRSTHAFDSPTHGLIPVFGHDIPRRLRHDLLHRPRRFPIPPRSPTRTAHVGS